jgi:hypothetical protein
MVKPSSSPHGSDVESVEVSEMPGKETFGSN